MKQGNFFEAVFWWLNNNHRKPAARFSSCLQVTPRATCPVSAHPESPQNAVSIEIYEQLVRPDLVVFSDWLYVLSSRKEHLLETTPVCAGELNPLCLHTPVSRGHGRRSISPSFASLPIHNKCGHCLTLIVESAWYGSYVGPGFVSGNVGDGVNSAWAEDIMGAVRCLFDGTISLSLGRVSVAALLCWLMRYS